MRERVYLLGGTLDIASGRGGTTVRARLRPGRLRADGSEARQAAS
jgi:signal transduction histidine kinase